MDGFRPEMFDDEEEEFNPGGRLRKSEETWSDFAQEMEQVFAGGGWLSKSPDYEFRAEQQRMAMEVAEALVSQRPVVIEAGTGVGKSLAYLIPSVLWALRERRKAVISTHTINLQEQLISKDLPLVRKVIPANYRDFQAVLLKGRGNYLCPRRLQRAMRQVHDLFTTAEHEELKGIQKWAQETKDGTLSDLDFSPAPNVWAQVCSEAHLCTPRTCPPGSGCFYQDTRRRIAEADVVVVNHTLFFTLLAGTENFGAEGEGFLFPNDFVVMDEAHTLENVAAKQLGLHLSQSGLRFDLHRLYNPRTQKGLFSVLRQAEAVRETVEVLDAAEDFFREVQNACKFSPAGKEFRVRQPGLVENRLSQHLARLMVRIRSLCDDKTLTENVLPDLQDMARRVTEARTGIEEFLHQAAEGRVYWVERSGIDGRNLSLHGAPVDVAELLREVFFGGQKTCILTSATFGAGEPDLRYFRRRVGADRSRAVEIGSPFDFEQQMRLYLVKKMPEPNQEGYEDALEHWISHFLKLSRGRAFVLFTSYKLMESLASRMQKFFARQGWELLVQGKGKPRHHLLQEFKDDVSSVLFGTESFWTGVDVPGEALSNVIITRLPFAVPDHPLTAARLELIEDRGGNPFTEYSVPEAILKLRQGIGRLIRSRKDQGIAVILDPRVLTKQYGKLFLAALPKAPRELVGG